MRLAATLPSPEASSAPAVESGLIRPALARTSAGPTSSAITLASRPVAGIDVGRLVKQSEGYTGADIAHACSSAAELALLDAAETGEVRMIGQADVERALSEVRPSIGPWFETARNVALFANEDGTYDELAAYLRKHRKL